MKHTPFKHAIAMMQAIAAAMSSGMSLPAIAASIGEYQSRGHGKGRRSGKKRGNNCTDWKVRADFHHPNESKACARRRSQIERGILAVSA